jgi:hypothetical protein
MEDEGVMDGASLAAWWAKRRKIGPPGPTKEDAGVPPIVTPGTVSATPWQTQVWEPDVGWAHKLKRGKGRRYTLKQLEFLKKCYERGAVNKHDKMSAETAEFLMTIIGTPAGEQRFPSDPYWKANDNLKPSFRPKDLLDKYVIKSWFGTQKANFEKAIAKAAEAAAAAADVVAVEDIIDDGGESD